MTTELHVGNVTILCDGGLLKFVDPNRKSPVQLKVEDIPLLLDFVDSFEWDRRRAFRVPVPKSSALLVDILWRGKTYAVTPLDVSVTGILVEFDEGDEPDLIVDESVTVTLRLRDISTTMLGTVLRQTGHGRHGIFFEGSVSDGRINPPPALRSIVNQMETEWIFQRIHGKLEAVSLE